MIVVHMFSQHEIYVPLVLKSVYRALVREYKNFDLVVDEGKRTAELLSRYR